MKHSFKLSEVDLQLFAESAGGGAAAGADGAAGATAAAAGQRNTGVQPAGDAGNAGAAAAGQQVQPEDPTAAFEALIKGQYRDQYNARVEDTVKKRLRGTNQELQRYQAAQPIFDILAQKYGVEATDLEGLAKAAQEDASFFQEEAMARGVDVKDLMNLKRIERENASMKQQLAMQQTKEHADRQFALWTQQAQQAKQVYPGLDIQAELENQDFQRLLRSGVDVRTAYEVIHKDEILHGAMAFAAQEAAKGVTDSIIAGAARPAENGSSSQGAVATKRDPSKFTDAEMKDIRERVRRGERITF